MAHDPLAEVARATRARWDARYREGERPWDTQTTPPEVIDFWQQRRLPRRGLALDIGCGPGTNVAFLARLGLTAIGVEIAGAALLTAQQRHTGYGGGRAPLFVCADVSALPFTGLDAHYILDVGCFHSLPVELRAGYALGILANLAPGGFYHLYAFDQFDPPPEMEHPGPLGMAEGEVAQRLAPLKLIEELVARPDRRPCRWYLLQRPINN
jgi:SAM-dependent methyltransferase